MSGSTLFLSPLPPPLRQVVNPLFILLSLGAAAETLIISGVSSFAFKYLAEQYSMSFDKAGNILGESLSVFVAPYTSLIST